LEITRSRGIHLIEDCAQAHGAVYKDRKVGGWGELAAFSFYPTKNLGAYGDGGAVVTSDPALAQRVRLLRQYGWEQRQVSKVKGMNSRLDDIQAAVLRAKLTHLDAWNARRRELARLYQIGLSKTELTLPCIPADSSPVYHHYIVRHPKRDQLQAYLEKQGIHCLVHYPLPVHLQPAYADLDYHPGDLPHSEEAARQVLSLPLFPEMTDEMVIHICGVIAEFNFSD